MAVCCALPFFHLLKQTKETVEGEVLESLPDTTFLLRLDDGRQVLGHLSGKMRLRYIKVIPGDRVKIELSEDGKRGRIVWRL